MAEETRKVHKLDEASKKWLFGLTPFSADATSDLYLLNEKSAHFAAIPKEFHPVFKVRPFIKDERAEALVADTDEKQFELARKVVKSWKGLFDCATGSEIQFKANNADGGCDSVLFSTLPDVTKKTIFGHAFLISGLQPSEKLGLK